MPTTAPRTRGSRPAAPLARGLAAAALLLLAAGCGGPWTARLTPEQTLAEAKRAYDRKNYSRARATAQRLLRRGPASPLAVDARLVVIDSYMAQKSWPRAYQECERLLDAHPQTKHRSAVLQREFDIAKALTASHAYVLFFRVSRREEGVKAFERIIEHAPFGPLADRALYEIGEAHYRAEDYQAAHDAYDRLLRQYPNSPLVIRARVRRATTNQRLAEGPAYDLAPAEAARRDMDDLARMSGNERVAQYARSLRDTMAQADYDSGLFYFERFSIEGGTRYMKAVMARYPDSEYSERAERILALVKRLVDEARPEEAAR